jgi:hypothetical protein
MTSFGVIVSRFRENTNSLRQFDEALMLLRLKSRDNDKTIEIQLQKLLSILRPIAEVLSGNLPKDSDFDEQGVLDILQSRHTQNWLEYKTQLLRLVDKLSTRHIELDAKEFEALSDVANAIDTQCATLFKKISGRA